ncbi:MAG: hypothetical protein JKY37_21875 [Nannocystaceae bacterium]|nr:hypothetical protein [Nannocystaceae bacterium]
MVAQPRELKAITNIKMPRTSAVSQIPWRGTRLSIRDLATVGREGPVLDRAALSEQDSDVETEFGGVDSAGL